MPSAQNPDDAPTAVVALIAGDTTEAPDSWYDVWMGDLTREWVSECVGPSFVICYLLFVWHKLVAVTTASDAVTRQDTYPSAVSKYRYVFMANASPRCQWLRKVGGGP